VRVIRSEVHGTAEDVQHATIHTNALKRAQLPKKRVRVAVAQVCDRVNAEVPQILGDGLADARNAF
jgi:hypothetical protein